jgi:hypothetical protein
LLFSIFDVLIFSDAIGKIRTSKVFWLENEPKLSDITYGVKKDQNVESHF